MTFAPRRPDRRRTIAAALIAALLGGVSVVAVAAPSNARPTIPQAQKTVAQLYREAEQASERFNHAKVELRAAKTELRRIKSDLRASRADVRRLRDAVAADVAADYQGRALDGVAALALATDPADLIEQMTTVDAYRSAQGQRALELNAETDRLESAEARATQSFAVVALSRMALAREKRIIDDRAAKAAALLSRLRDERRERLAERASRSDSRVEATATSATGPAAAAVAYALAQVGDAYSYGATGESAFDCSGLTMRAWAQAGVALPHSSVAQMGSGTPVSTSALQPGDLVFYYSPVSHVGIYVGNGQIVHASNPSTGVRMDPVGMMPLTGAVRPG